MNRVPAAAQIGKYVVNMSEFSFAASDAEFRCLLSEPLELIVILARQPAFSLQRSSRFPLQMLSYSGPCVYSIPNFVALSTYTFGHVSTGLQTILHHGSLDRMKISTHFLPTPRWPGLPLFSATRAILLPTIPALQSLDQSHCTVPHRIAS
jgi:hypothetical protein